MKRVLGKGAQSRLEGRSAAAMVFLRSEAEMMTNAMWQKESREALWKTCRIEEQKGNFVPRYYLYWQNKMIH